LRINWSDQELLLAAELVFDNNWKALDDNSSKVLELSLFLRQFGKVGGYAVDPKFRSPASVALKTRNIASLHPNWQGSSSNSGKGDLAALERFLVDPVAAKKECLMIWESLDVAQGFEVDNFPLDVEANLSAIEGRILAIKITKYERSPALRKSKIASMIATDSGVACEACGFDFYKAYGERGLNFIEVHHVNPLHFTGEVVSKMEDLVGLCSNCHRMIHRGVWITPSELKSLLRRSVD
jgi:5-methylcytosine-specific restriction protein A